jgi:hypothetical protein
LTGDDYPSSLPSDAVTSGTVTWTDDTKNSYITKVSSAMVLLHNPAGVPAQVVAMLNGRVSSERISLADLAKTKLGKGYTAATSADAAPSKFIMSNTVYNDADGVLIQATKVSTANLCKTAEAAALNPMQIYVERVVTKVGVDIDHTKTVDANTDVFMLENTYGDCPGQYSISGTPDGVTVTDADKQLYVKFTGWTTFDEAPSTLTLKDITGTYGGVSTKYSGSTYDPTTDTSFAWNAPDKCRSYWAYAYFNGYYDMKKKEVTYPDINLAFGEGAGHYSYPFENTSGAVSSASGLATKVILAAQLCTYNATTGKFDPYSMCKFMGQTMSLTKAKSYITNILKQEGVYMSVEGSDGSKKVEAITDDDWEFWNIAETPTASYKVLVRWKYEPRDGNATYCDKDGKAIDYASIFRSMPEAQLWENGQCYYYTYIQHINNKNAIVRNHWYTVTINSVTGFGTPYANPEAIYDADDPKFDPTRPEDDDWILGAEIDIEAWRIYNTTADLSSTKTTDDSNEETASSNPAITPGRE